VGSLAADLGVEAEARSSFYSAGHYYFPIIDSPANQPIIAALRLGFLNLKTPAKSAQKTIAAVVCAVAILWVLGCVSIYNVMRRPPESFARVMAKIPGPAAFLVLPFETLWRHARAGTLSVGDPAPDFRLAKLDKFDQVQLSRFSAQGRPVVLVFGSYT